MGSGREAPYAAAKAGVHDGKIDIAEVHAPFSHQELILCDALGLDSSVEVNLSGGALAGNIMMAAGLVVMIASATLFDSGAFWSEIKSSFTQGTEEGTGAEIWEQCDGKLDAEEKAVLRATLLDTSP